MKKFVSLLVFLILLGGIVFAVDPSGSVNSPASGTYWKNGAHTITFSFSDGDSPTDVNAAISYSGDSSGSITTDDLNLVSAGICDSTNFGSTVTCNYSWTQSLADGNYTIEVLLKDIPNADSNTISSSSFRVDNTVPTATFIQPNDSNKSSYNSNTVIFDVNDSSSGVSNISISGIANSVFSFANHCTKQGYNYHCQYNETAMDMNNQSYTINVVGTDSAGNSGSPSGTITLTYIDNTAPAQITGFTATAGEGKIDLSWSASTAIDFKNYLIYRSTTTGFTPESGNLIKTETNKSTTTFSNTGLTNGTTYYYKIIAEDKSGNKSPASEQKSATPQEENNVPGSVSITSETHDEDEWTTDDDPEFDWGSVSNATGYRYKLNDESSYDLDEESDYDTIDDTDKAYSNLNDGIYWFHVAACNSDGCGNTDDYKIKLDKTGPGAPEDLYGLSQSDGSIYISWGAPEDLPAGDDGEDNSGVEKYIVYRSIKKDFDIIDAGVRKFENITGTNFTDEESDLTEGIAYYYKVRAVDNMGNPGSISAEKRVLNSAGSCGITISAELPEAVGEGNLDIRIDIFGGKIYNAKIKVKMPDKGFETTKTGQEGAIISDVFSVPSGIEGKGSVLVEGQDENGKACEKLFEFEVDSVAPELEIISPTNNEEISEETTIKASASDEGTIEKVEAFVGGKSIGKLEKKESDYALKWNSAAKENGEYKLEIKAEDKAGNKSIKEITIKINNFGENLYLEKEKEFTSVDSQTLRNAGLKEELLNDSIELLNEIKPTRKLMAIRTDNGITMQITVSLTNNGDSKTMSLIESIPKSVANSASLISSNTPFTVLVDDPVIKFSLGEVLNNEDAKITYIVGTGLTESQADTIESAFDSFTPPILLEGDVESPIEITPLSDLLWLVFIAAAVVFIILVATIMLGGGAFLFHRMKKKKNNGFGVTSDGLHTVYKEEKGVSDFFRDVLKSNKDQEEKRGKFAYKGKE